MDKIFYRKMQKKALIYIIAIFLVIFAVFLLKFSKDVSTAIVASINSCLVVIIPSLFGFMVVSNILVKSNVYILISKPFYFIAKYLFRIPPELFSIFLLGNIGGYPIGVKLITELLKEEKISKDDADSMLCYCYCSGPAFIVGAIGVNVFSNVLVGLLIYLSILMSNFFIAIILSFKNKIPNKKKIKNCFCFNGKVLTESIESAVKSLSLICGMIIFFSIIISIVDKVGLLALLAKYLSFFPNISSNYAIILVKSFFEFSTISGLPQYCYIIIPIISAFVSFGGLCVIMQISGIAENKISFKKFIITRPLQIFLSSIFSYFLIKLFAKDIVIMTLLKPSHIIHNNHSIFPSICIIFMIILLLRRKKVDF